LAILSPLFRKSNLKSFILLDGWELFVPRQGEENLLEMKGSELNLQLIQSNSSNPQIIFCMREGKQRDLWAQM